MCLECWRRSTLCLECWRRRTSCSERWSRSTSCLERWSISTSPSHTPSSASCRVHCCLHRMQKKAATILTHLICCPKPIETGAGSFSRPLSIVQKLFSFLCKAAISKSWLLIISLLCFCCVQYASDFCIVLHTFAAGVQLCLFSSEHALRLAQNDSRATTLC